jgi:PhzF family phenazine biosynthesis protein
MLGDMRIPYFHVDAFTDRVFGGNSAGVCPLETWPDNKSLQRIAAENQLAETAFFTRRDDGAYDLRWFSPTLEVDLCGHATLASAHVLWRHLDESRDLLIFHTLSGPLTVTRHDDRIVLDFPSRPAVCMEPPADVERVLGLRPLFCGKARDYLFLFRDEEQIRELRPDFARLASRDIFGVIATAPGRKVDFVSRFFAPRAGILEDPATGSSHCTLIPFWAERLGKTMLHAKQLSARGGEFFCELRGERVRIAGQAVTYLAGTIEL